MKITINQKQKSQQTKQNYRDYNNNNAKPEYRNHNKTNTR